MFLGLEFDFLAVIGLVKQIRKSFIGAPEQFKAISDDVRGFSIVLQDIEANCTDLSPEHSQEYQSVVTSCKHLLVRLKRTLEEYSEVAKDDKTGKRTAIKRVWKRLKWEPDDIRDIRSQISVKIGTLRSLNDQVTSHNIVKLIRHQEDTEREATIKWVSDINYVAQQNDIFLRCQTGSRKWLFESEAYLEWLRQKGSLLFCPGNPGTGKTFTTAMVVESLRLANDAETLTTYMYCSYQNHTQTIEKLLCSLLRVAFEEADSEADGAISTCKQLRLSNKSISRQHCLTLLQDLFSRFARVNLIVDAIDELTNEVRRPLIYDLLKLHGHSDVSLFVTSRGIPEIQRLFETCKAYTSLEVRSSDEDIRNFLRDNIFQLPNFVARSPKLQNEVINSVTNASAGMFLLAELYLKSLANIISVGSLRTRVSNLTTGSNAYDSLYEDSMLRIGFQGPELERIAIQMLLVLTCARRPLSPQELSHALSIDETSDAFDEEMVPDMDDLVAACTGLAVLDDTSNVVHLVHKSAAEYFERSRSRWFPKANEKMAFMCLRYLQIAETEPEETRGEEAPFFHYAKANWCYHSMESEKEAAMMSDASRTESTSDSSSLPNRLAVTQLSIQQMTKEVVDVDSSIVEACHAGHQAWVEQLLVVRNYDMNIHGIRQEKFISDRGISRDTKIPPLTIAVERRDQNMTRLLLEHGGDPNIFNANGQTPLFIAAMNGFDNLVSLLLDQNLIEPDLMCQHSYGLSTAFLTSIELGQEGCFRMLLERSDRRARDSQKRGAMWLAASSGHIGIISELLKCFDVEIDYADTDCGSPLTAAVRGDHEDAALLLMPYLELRSCNYCGVTQIHNAVRHRLYNLLEWLLKHDASAVDSELFTHPHECRHLMVDCGQYGIERVRTPLTTAIYLRDAQATQILLPYANPNQGLNTWRPLHGAAEWGNAEIFELLLKKEGIELDPVDEHGRTPFLLAAERGHCDIMNTLLQKERIQLDIRNGHGNIYEDCYHILTSILDKDVNKKDLDGSSFLHRACSLRPKISMKNDTGTQIFEAKLLETNSGHLVTELLKRPGIDVNLLDEDGNTPLLLAVKNHQQDVVRLLLEREDTDVFIRGEEWSDALLLASAYRPMFTQLFSKSASSMKADIRPLSGQVPSRYRVDHWPEILNTEFKGYAESIFSMLLHDKRRDYNTSFRGRGTYLYPKRDELHRIMRRVAEAGTKGMIQAALEVTKLASELKTILHDDGSLIVWALMDNEDDEAVGLLIALCSSAVLQKADTKGRTPLSYAAERATSRVARSLLEAGTPSVDILALDGEGHSFLCHLMMPRYFYGVIRRIHHLLQPNVGAIRGYIHSPFLCALEKQKRSYGTLGRKPRITSQKSEEIFWFMNNLQRYTILSDFFHPGLDFSRCATTDGVLEILGEKKRGVEYDVYDHSCLCIRALRRYVKKDN
ncbi:hypothetical protein CI102_9102 [Trichoderma harzianum]|nr:hypothetical protein CI102_9102 [Trichoderma harzianum]